MPDNNFLNDIDARTKLAGSNKMEILLFTLGTKEIFGINVFKVREVSQTPTITQTPNRQEGVEGMISLRGNVIPVVKLANVINLKEMPVETGNTMIVTEYNRHTQAFLVHDVDRIIRVDWEKIRPPSQMLAANNQIITAITELEDGRLVSILDVEQILDKLIGDKDGKKEHIELVEGNHSVFFADDSAVARKELARVLDLMGIRYQFATDGKEGLEMLMRMADAAEAERVPLSSKISLIITDAEMPRMDGYVLTKHIKSDKRFNDIQVLMHSSLSSEANKALGQESGVDKYIPKFNSTELSEALSATLNAIDTAKRRDLKLLAA